MIGILQSHHRHARPHGAPRQLRFALRTALPLLGASGSVGSAIYACQILYAAGEWSAAAASLMMAGSAVAACAFFSLMFLQAVARPRPPGMGPT